MSHGGARCLNGAPIVTPTKSGHGRNVALDAATITAFRSHRVQQAEERLALGPAYEDLGFVFCYEDGRPLHPNSVTRVFYRLSDGAGLPRIRLHDLRHSAVTEMLRSGVPVKVVSERVGHASTSFTQDVYAAVLPGMQADAADRIAATIDRVR